MVIFEIKSFNENWSDNIKYEIISNSESKNKEPHIVLKGMGGKTIVGCLTINYELLKKNQNFIGGIELNASKGGKNYSISIPYKLFPSPTYIEPKIITYKKDSDYHFKVVSPTDAFLNKIICVNKNIDIPFKEVMSFEGISKETLMAFTFNDALLMKMDNLNVIEFDLSNGEKIQRQLVVH